MSSLCTCNFNNITLQAAPDIRGQVYLSVCLLYCIGKSCCGGDNNLESMSCHLSRVQVRQDIEKTSCCEYLLAVDSVFPSEHLKIGVMSSFKRQFDDC